MNFLVKLALVVAFSVITIRTTSAQYVTLPDTNFRNYLIQKYPSCFNGSKQLDTNCTAILYATSLRATNLDISNLAGIQYFIGLDTLVCSLNHLTSLPSLPDSLTYLDCINNQIITLSSLPDSLRFLDCAKNNLKNLPALPPYLRNLICNYNQLTTLPNLPNYLTEIFCSNNQITTLPPLPSSLALLDIDSNQVSTLPTLPFGLTALNCADNPIYCLPLLPTILIYAALSGTHVTCIPNSPAQLTTDGSYPLCNDTNNIHNCATTATGITNAIITTGLQVFPNPSIGIVTINCPFTATGVNIAGMDGKTVYQTFAGTTNYTIDLSGIAKGLYVAQVSYANGVVTQKLILQ